MATGKLLSGYSSAVNSKSHSDCDSGHRICVSPRQTKITEDSKREWTPSPVS